MSQQYSMASSTATPTFEVVDRDDVTVLALDDDAAPPWKFTVGRGSHNDVYIDDPTVSQEHAVIEIHLLADGALKIKLVPKQTTNATRIGPVTAKPERKYSIKDCVPFFLGGVKCRVRLCVEEDAPAMELCATQAIATPSPCKDGAAADDAEAPKRQV